MQSAYNEIISVVTNKNWLVIDKVKRKGAGCVRDTSEKQQRRRVKE